MLGIVPFGVMFSVERLKDEAMSSANLGYKSPVRKIVAMLLKARDNWKEKYQQVKLDLRRVQQQNRVVEKSRQQWKARALCAEAELKKIPAM